MEEHLKFWNELSWVLWVAKILRLAQFREYAANCNIPDY
jgi:hypothetical protein